MRFLIGVAEIILEKSITIQILIFQSHSAVEKTLQTLKSLSLFTGEGSKKSFGLWSFSLVGQAWDRPQRFCSLCAASLSKRARLCAPDFTSPCSPLHPRQEQSCWAELSLGKQDLLLVPLPCSPFSPHVISTTRSTITWIPLMPVKHSCERRVEHMCKCPLSWLLARVIATENSGWAQVTKEESHWASCRCFTPTCTSSWPDAGRSTDGTVLFSDGSQAWDVPCYVTSQHGPCSVTLLFVGPPVLGVHGGEGFGISQWSSAGRERSDGEFRVPGKSALLFFRKHNSLWMHLLGVGSLCPFLLGKLSPSWNLAWQTQAQQQLCLHLLWTGTELCSWWHQLGHFCWERGTQHIARGNG